MSLTLLHGHGEEVTAWVGWRIPITAKRLQRDPTVSPFGPAYAIGVLDGAGTLIAGVVFHAWDPDFKTVEMSFAADSPRWLNRRVIREIMSYAFETLQCNRINLGTPKTYRAARKFVEAFGFKREGVATDGFGPGQDVIISRMLKREWLASKWMKQAAH